MPSQSTESGRFDDFEFLLDLDDDDDDDDFLLLTLFDDLDDLESAASSSSSAADAFFVLDLSPNRRAFPDDLPRNVGDDRKNVLVNSSSEKSANFVMPCTAVPPIFRSFSLRSCTFWSTSRNALNRTSFVLSSLYCLLYVAANASNSTCFPSSLRPEYSYRPNSSGCRFNALCANDNDEYLGLSFWNPLLNGRLKFSVATVMKEMHKTTTTGTPHATKRPARCSAGADEDVTASDGWLLLYPLT